MDAVVHFEIPAEDMERAKKFYKAVFGWSMTDMDMPQMKYSMVQTTETDKEGMPKKPGAINGGIRSKMQKRDSPTVVVDVKSIEEALKKIKANGGKALTEKMTVGDMGFYMICMDCEGNQIGIWESK